MKTKTFILTLLLMLLFTATTLAAKPTITADQQYFDINTGLYVLNGNVYIEVKNRVITADQAKVNMGSLEVWGNGNITVKQDDIFFTADSVYVYGAQDRAIVEGNVHFTRTNLNVIANRVDYNWRDKNAQFTDNVQIQQNGNSWSADTVKYNIITDTFL
ncbi:LptA/OstA family protein [Pelosinus propionicus]|uniref:Lipopolysaccharide transport protein LptA n=1 Tax=Pelosinus propionicus DSM 13327 TaxID=1123291 RepID=A0A1I4GRU0_9FIRM|nr:LptA/OstA family protein [Pelosinus propionicus]SFL32619.1 lipopolysaccharide transport protein LptA [Pelosinus propionicus DSM 13327]